MVDLKKQTTKNTEAMNVKLYNMLVEDMKKRPNNILVHIIHLFSTQIQG